MFATLGSGKTTLSGLCRDDTTMLAVGVSASVDAAKRHRPVG
jgi:hypothetical protein